jgi:hypothetical protein
MYPFKKVVLVFNHRIFSVLPPVCRKAPTAVAVHGRHQSPLRFHKGAGSRRLGGAGSYSPRTCCQRVPAAVSLGSIQQPVVLPSAGSGSVHCRTGLRTAMATTDRRWKRHTSGACVHRVQQHSGRVAATMQPGGGYRGRPVEERPGKGSWHWLYCRRHCRPAASWCGAVGIGAGTFASAPGRAGITRTIYDNHHMRQRIVNQALK